MQRKSFLLLTAMLMVGLGLFFSLTSCGPDNLPPKEKNASITINLKDASKLDRLKAGEILELEVEITTQNVTKPLELLLRPTTGDAFKTVEPRELPPRGGKVIVTIQSNTNGMHDAMLSVYEKDGNTTQSMRLKTEIFGGDQPQTGTIEVFEGYYGNEDPKNVSEIDAKEIVFAANYSQESTILTGYVVVAKGLENTPVRISIEDNVDNVFSMVKNEFPGKPGRSEVVADTKIQISHAKAGAFQATLVIRFGTIEKRIPIKVSLVAGPADELIPNNQPASTKVKASFQGKDIPNGSTLKIRTTTLHSDLLSPPVDFLFPEAKYHGKVVLDKPAKTAWCMGGVCVPDITEVEVAEAETELGFEFYKEQLKPGYKNRAVFTFTKGTDVYTFTLELDLER